ncbi:MAG: GDSL-type esterase/lipase family protein [Nitrospirales bacterium]|nr:GDSL-type esterase/lipase family protein [Nitrospirales bacterium]
MTIVCFGDSLTEGYQSSRDGGPGFTPYGQWLREWLGKRGTIWIRGVCGETTQQMKERFPSDVLALHPGYAVILGGTNDLGWGLPAKMVIKNLVWMYAEAQSHGILPVSVTIPSLGGLGMPGSISSYRPALQSRVEVNEALKTYCQMKQIPIVDLFSVTCDPQSQELASEFSDDGLHLTELGYRTLAHLLWNQVFKSRLENQ